MTARSVVYMCVCGCAITYNISPTHTTQHIPSHQVMWRVANASGPNFSAAPALNADGTAIVVPLHGKK